MSRPNTFRISPETFRFLVENRDFYKSLRELQAQNETPLLPKATAPDSKTEFMLRDNGDIEVALRLPLDDNDDAEDGRLYVKDSFVFDPSESVLKSYHRSFENNGKGGKEWEEWLAKYQALAKRENRSITDHEVQSFAQRVARTAGRPITDDAANTLPDIKAAFTAENALLTTTNLQVLGLDAGLQLTIKDKLNCYNLVRRDGKLEVTLQLAADDDADAANGRILLRDKFILDGETLAFERFERKWSLAPEAAENTRFAEILRLLQTQPGPPSQEAEAFIKNLLPALLPKGEPDLAPALSLMGGAPPLPAGYRSPLAKRRADPAGLQATALATLEAMRAVTQEQLAKRYDESRGWLHLGAKVDSAAEQSAIESLFQKTKETVGKNAETRPMALLQELATGEREKELFGRMLHDPLLMELDSLAKESDPALRGQALAALARRMLVEGGLAQSAAGLAEELKKDPATRRVGEDILAIVEGKGNFGQKADFVLAQFSKEVTKPSMLLGMAAAPFLGTALELGSLKLGYQLAKGAQLGWKARGLAELAGMGGEALAFTAIHKTVDSLGHDPSKVWEHTGGEFLSSLMLFGAMRGVHLGSGFATARMAEGQWGTAFGQRFGTEAYSGFGFAPTGRILEGRFAAAAGAGVPTLTTTGKIAGGLLNHGGGIAGMQFSAFLSRSFGLTPDNGQDFGGNLFDAMVSYTQAMVGFNLANRATGGRLQSNLAVFRQSVAGLRDNLTVAEPKRPPAAQVGLPRPDGEATEPDRLAEPSGEESSAPKRRKKKAAGSKVPKSQGPSLDFSTLEAAFRSAKLTPEQQAGVLAFVGNNFSPETMDRPKIPGWSLPSQEEMRVLLPKIIQELTQAGFKSKEQLKFLQDTEGMGMTLGIFMEHAAGLIASLRSNGLDAEQIKTVVGNFIQDRTKDADYYRRAAEQHHCVLFSPLERGAMPKILSALEALETSEWSVREKLEFLSQTRLDSHVLDRFSRALPEVSEWMRTAGWTKSQAISYLAAYSRSYTRLDVSNVRLILAEYGFPAASQVELLSNLIQAKRSYSRESPDPQHLKVFLGLLRERPWPPEVSFRILNDLAKVSGEESLSQLPSLGKLIRTLGDQGWPESEVKDLIDAFTEHGGSSSAGIFLKLEGYIPWLEGSGWGRPAVRGFLRTLASHSREQFGEALETFQRLASYAGTRQRQFVAQHFLALMNHCNDYNRSQVLNFLLDQGGLFRDLGPANFIDHLELYAQVMERWPRIGYAVLHNLAEATKTGAVPPAVVPVRDTILQFIEKTHGFNTSHYRAYLKEGEPFLLRIDGYAQNILKENLGIDSIKALMRNYDSSVQVMRGNQAVQWGGNGFHEPANDGYGNYHPASEGEKFLLGLIQRVSPTSGVSFARDSEMIRLLRRVLEAGDLRSHIPQAWQGKRVEFEMGRGAMDLKPGETLDPQGRIKHLLDQFRLQPGESEPSHAMLVEAMVSYLASGRKPEERERLRQILFKRAAASEELREKLEHITELDFASLTILEEIFSDADALPKFLKEAFNHVPRGQGLVTQLGGVQTLLGDGDGLARQIKKVAQNKNLPAERRREILTNLVKAYKPEGIQLLILPREDLPQEIKDEIEAVLGAKPDLTPKEIIQELLQEPLEAIEAEKNKYQYQRQGVQKIGLRAVKGPAFGLHGFLSGVCIAPDIELWKDPNFKLLAITAEDEHQVVGYIHVYETTIGGKKYLTLPGINPSAEYLGGFNRKQAAELFQKLMVGVKDFAVAGGYQGVYIPTETNIHSNRGYIQEAIQKAGYATKKIPQVKWNNLPSPYPFTQVYVAWEKNGH